MLYRSFTGALFKSCARSYATVLNPGRRVYVTQFILSNPSASGCLPSDMGLGCGGGLDLGRSSIVKRMTTTNAESATIECKLIATLILQKKCVATHRLIFSYYPTLHFPCLCGGHQAQQLFCSLIPVFQCKLRARKSRYCYIMTNLDDNVLSFHVSPRLVLTAVKLHLYPSFTTRSALLLTRRVIQLTHALRW